MSGHRLAPSSATALAAAADRTIDASDELTRENFCLFLGAYKPPFSPRRLIPDARGVRGSRTTNELFFVRGRSLFAVKIDANGSLVGAPAPPTDIVGVSDPGLPRRTTPCPTAECWWALMSRSRRTR